jgi:hypothetical protein
VKKIINNASCSYDEAVVELLREDLTIADEYLAAVMEEANEDGGREALSSALRNATESLAQDNQYRWFCLIAE